MGLSEYTLMADASGRNITVAPTGTEMDNFASRRLILTDELQYARIQFGATNSTVECEIQYSHDQGATWGVLIPRFNRQIAAQLNQCSDWTNMPEDAISADILVRAMLYGNNVATRVTYLSLQIR